jgi:hypothetical protein
MKILFSGLLRRVVWQELTDVSEMLAVSIIRAMRLNGATAQKTAIFIPDEFMLEKAKKTYH